jgi:hypothetical protein
LNKNQKPEFKEKPVMIKIEKYKYHFTNAGEYKKTGKIWRKTFVKDFLPYIDKSILTNIFKTYSLPEIDEKRYKHISQFQNIPVVDIVCLFLLFKFITKLFI